MAQHFCRRCGIEDTCHYGNWADRHPAWTVFAGLFTLVFMGMMFSEYPIAATSMTVLAAVWLGVRAVGREQRRRAALAARADYSHAALMAQWAPQPIHLPPPAAPSPTRTAAPWFGTMQEPTGPMRRR
jgi:hypothetical protein